MASHLSRRGFLQSAGTGVVLGASATVPLPALVAEDPPLLPPLDEKAPRPKNSAASTDPQSACCSPAAKIIFPCSGSADVGKIADLAARKLMADGVGKMSCLAGVGGRVSVIMETTRTAQAILAIDGCPLHCARHTLEQAGFKKSEHLCLSDLGMAKGKTPVTEEAVAKVASQGKSRLPK